ncbi:hypothetical protein GCM10027417_19740 [Glutamicibacter endophyticus]
MGVDWTALEEALRVSALRHAAEVIREHPDQDFYAIALYGVSTDPDTPVAMPLLALNSLQALERDRRTELREQLVERGEDLDDEPAYEERPDAFDEPIDDVEAADAEDPDYEADAEDLDEVLNALEAELEGDDQESFYSDKWEPSDWHWSSIDLCEDVAAQVWSEAIMKLAELEGWETTIRRYYSSLVNVAISLREELTVKVKPDLVTYVADDDHAQRLLELCLTPAQLAEHFPQLERGDKELSGQQG